MREAEGEALVLDELAAQVRQAVVTGGLEQVMGIARKQIVVQVAAAVVV